MRHRDDYSDHVQDLSNNKQYNDIMDMADKFIQTADAGQRFILRLGIVAVPVISIGAAYILIKRKYIIDERKYEELVEEIKSTNKKWFNNKAEQ